MVAGARSLKGPIAVGAAVGVAAAVIAVLLVRRPAPDGAAFPVPGEGVGAGLDVEVLNASGADGLARAMTTRLRHAGIDVVFFGTAPEDRDSTVLLVRQGDSARAAPVRAALGFGRIEVAPDPRALLDVSVLLGRDAVARGRDP